MKDAQLHARFAAGIRTLIRHKLPGIDPESGVDQVLSAAAAAIRRSGPRSDPELAAAIRNSLKSFVTQHLQRHAPPKSAPDARYLRDTADFQSPAREILARFYSAGQSEAEISREMNLAIEAIRDVKQRASRAFREQRTARRG
jgi:DNA-binding NarL/FixJ family response regulator